MVASVTGLCGVLVPYHVELGPNQGQGLVPTLHQCMVGMIAQEPCMKPATAVPIPVPFMVGSLNGPCGVLVP